MTAIASPRRAPRDGNTFGLVRLTDVAKAAGITYRQADHWVHQDYVRPTYIERRKGEQVEARLGAMQGRVAVLNPAERAVLFIMADLVRAGIAPETAAEVARHMVEHGTTTADLAPGVRLTITEVA